MMQNYVNNTKGILVSLLENYLTLVSFRQSYNFGYLESTIKKSLLPSSVKFDKFVDNSWT